MFVGSISKQEGEDFFQLCARNRRNGAQVFHMCIHEKCSFQAQTKVFNRLREYYVIAKDGHRGKVRDDLTYF